MLGKWNKSVILSYVGLSLAIIGIYLAIKGYDMKYTQICFMYVGICDLFDGTVARMCKRTKEEKQFGIELDSLIDVIDFLALPIVILICLGITKWYALPVYIIYTIFGIARLAHFNITTEDSKTPRKFYEGLPVTYAAFFFTTVYLLSYVLKTSIFNIIYLIMTLVIALLYILKIKIHKPNLIASVIFLILAIILTVLYLFVL